MGRSDVQARLRSRYEAKDRTNNAAGYPLGDPLTYPWALNVAGPMMKACRRAGVPRHVFPRGTPLASFFHTVAALSPDPDDGPTDQMDTVSTSRPDSRGLGRESNWGMRCA